MDSQFDLQAGTEKKEIEPSDVNDVIVYSCLYLS
jgi:hypothetical protein